MTRSDQVIRERMDLERPIRIDRVLIFQFFQIGFDGLLLFLTDGCLLKEHGVGEFIDNLSLKLCLLEKFLCHLLRRLPLIEFGQFGLFILPFPEVFTSPIQVLSNCMHKGRMACQFQKIEASSRIS